MLLSKAESTSLLYQMKSNGLYDAAAFSTNKRMKQDMSIVEKEGGSDVENPLMHDTRAESCDLDIEESTGESACGEKKETKGSCACVLFYLSVCSPSFHVTSCYDAFTLISFE